MITHRSQVDEITELLNQAYYAVYEELTNTRECDSKYLSGDVMDLNKTYLDLKIVSVIEALKKVKSIKEINPKKIVNR